jgi:acyl dehydratase
VAENHRIDGSRVERQRLPVPLPKILQALEEPAVEQDSPVPDTKEVLRARDSARSAEELQRGRVHHDPAWASAAAPASNRVAHSSEQKYI